MKLGIMQSYFFPYIGYFSLIKNTDRFILLDVVQFIRHGWIERNRVLKPDEGWQYIRVPLQKHHRDTKIIDILIDNTQKWQDKIIAQIQHYKKKAPYFSEVVSLLKEVFSREYTTITELNKASLTTVCRYLQISTPIEIFSEMKLNIEPPNAPDEWALNICKALGNVSEYWNPPGGISFFDRSKYEKNGIKIKFQSIKITPYDQKRPVFEPGLSIIDVMMFNPVDKINYLLDQYEFL